MPGGVIVRQESLLFNRVSFFVSLCLVMGVVVIFLPAAAIAERAPDPNSTWYLAEGSGAWGLATWITIFNPNEQQITFRETYMTTSGLIKGQASTLDPMSMCFTDSQGGLTDNMDFATKIECLEGKPIVVERHLMLGIGVAGSVGVNAPAKTWYLPEGSSAWGYECWLLMQNPGDVEAKCQVTYMFEGAPPVTVSKSIPANSRRSYNMRNDIGERDASMRVMSDLPIVAERTMFLPGKQEGHSSTGATAPASDFFLAEGSTSWGFTTYLLVQNPNNTATRVDITYMTTRGLVTVPAFMMPPNSRKTIRVNDHVESADFAIKIHGSAPIVAERSMYWQGARSPACHDSIGIASPHGTWYLPDCEAYIIDSVPESESWALVLNPNDSAVEVEVRYMTGDVQEDVAFRDSIPGNSRKSYNMADKIEGNAATIVTSKTPGKKVIVEGSSYWQNRDAGSNTIGAYSN